MSKVLTTPLAALLAFSVLSLLSALAVVVLAFILNYSGFNLSAAAVVCTKTYWTLKWTYLYLPLRAHTITAILWTCLAVCALVLIAKVYCPLKDLPPEALGRQKIEKSSICAMYVLTSLEVLFAISNAGGGLSLLVDNNSCQVLEKSKLVILTVASFLGFVIVLTQWIVLVAMDCQSDESQPDSINLDDVKGNEVAKEEDTMSKQLELQMKEYFSNNANRKEEMMEGLLKREDEIYGGITVNPNNEAPLFQPQPQQSQQFQQPQQPQQRSLQNAEQEQPEKKQKKPKKDKGKNIRKKKNMASLMHSYPSDNPAKANEQGKPFLPIEEQSDEDSSEEEEVDENMKKIDEECLYAKFDDNLSEKFEEGNFQLDYDLDTAIRNNKEEDLSPLELKELMYLTKASFALKGTTAAGLQLEKTYDNPEGFQVRVNFVKVKEHKQAAREQVQRLIDNPNPAESTQVNEKATKKVIEQMEEKPITEQISKLLKVILFNHSEFYKKREEVQTECPIARYVEHDDGFEIIQSNEKADKHKKVEYSKEQLLFSKKRKDASEDKEKGTFKQEFNEAEFIKMERKELFGPNWTNEYDRKETPSDKLGQSRKRRLVEVIRSKYYQ